MKNKEFVFELETLSQGLTWKTQAKVFGTDVHDATNFIHTLFPKAVYKIVSVAEDLTNEIT